MRNLWIAKLACRLVLFLGAVAGSADSLWAQPFDDVVEIMATTTDPTLRFLNTGGLPQWELTGQSGGSLIVDDAFSGSRPLTIESGAHDDSLYINAAGQVGLGGYPFADLHILKPYPQTAYIRLESNGDVGTNVPRQAWDLISSSTPGPDFLPGFSIFQLDGDPGGGNLTPFSIYSGASTNSLVVSTAGRVGIGTGSPAAPLHVTSPALGATAEILARYTTNDDVVGSLIISNASASNGVFIPKIVGRSLGNNAGLVTEAVVSLDTGSNPAIAYNAVKGPGGGLTTRPLVAYRNNGSPVVTIRANGTVQAFAFTNASSRELKDKIADLTSEKASMALRQITPVEFVYKDDATAEPRVGFIAEDVPDLIAEPDRKSVPVMDVVAMVTRVVKDQQQTIDLQRSEIDAHRKTMQEQRQHLDEQKNAIDQQQRTISELISRLGALESQVRDKN